MSTRKLDRTTFETTRAAEYFDARELQAQTGQPRSKFAAVALKELLTEGVAGQPLDACETAGVAPQIAIEVRQEGKLIRLSVSDSGPGIPHETVRKILNFNTRTSDKAACRSPTKGAQGNAPKTVIGIPYALGAAEPMVVEGRGVRHGFRAWADPGARFAPENHCLQSNEWDAPAYVRNSVGSMQEKVVTAVTTVTGRPRSGAWAPRGQGRPGARYAAALCYAPHLSPFS